MTQQSGMDRRSFVRITALAGSGLALGVALPGRGSGTHALAPLQPNAFVRVSPDGVIRIWVARSEMGQGVRTSLPMIVADELDAAWEDVDVVHADAHPEAYGRMMTVGSTSVRGGAWTRLRTAGAAAREMLVEAAARRWGVPASELRTSNSLVHHDSAGRSLGYGDLADEAATLAVPQEPTLKGHDDFTLIGTSPPLIDTPDIVTGRAGFGIDARVPGMLFATVLRPGILGGRLDGFDDTAARAVPGVRDVFEISSGIAVVGENTWAAFEGAAAVEAEWAHGDFRMSSDEISAELRRLAGEGDAVVALEKGSADSAVAASGTRIRASYEAPYLAHATMEPMNATAHVSDGRCEVWAPSQNPQGAQGAAARLTGLPLEQVTVHVTRMGCGWGRRSRTGFVEDAVEASMKIGAPVQVLWTREEDMRNDYYRPTSYSEWEGAVDDQGRLAGLRARVVATPINYARYGGEGGDSGGRADGNSVDGIATVTYDLPNYRVDYVRPDIRVPTGHWRSVGPSQSTWMFESFIDELAHAAGRDPVAFRLDSLRTDVRLRRVLEIAAEESGWGSPPPEGRARGVGLVLDKGGRVAMVAEVSVTDGAVRVHRVTCAADCGTVIHPGIVEAQLSGSVLAGLSAALYGQVTIRDGRVETTNFDTYRMLRMREAPQVDVHLVASREEPGGVGEPGLPPIAPAVTNAVFALTGTRIRRLPIQNELRVSLDGSNR